MVEQSPKDKIVIREISLEDIDLLLEMARENGLSEWTKQSYVDQINAVHTLNLCVTKENKTIGFILLRLIIIKFFADLEQIGLNLSNPSSKNEVEGKKFEDKNEAEILNIVIERRSQNQGFGRTLLEETFRKLKIGRIGFIWLEVRASNLQAISFYEANGFTRQYLRKNYYVSPDENAVIMKKDL